MVFLRILVVVGCCLLFSRAYADEPRTGDFIFYCGAAGTWSSRDDLRKDYSDLDEWRKPHGYYLCGVEGVAWKDADGIGVLESFVESDRELQEDVGERRALRFSTRLKYYMPRGILELRYSVRDSLRYKDRAEQYEQFGAGFFLPIYSTK